MLLSLGLASNTYARERNGSSGIDNSGGRLDYDRRTFGIGKKLGGIVGAGGAIGGSGEKIAGGLVGEELGSRAGDAWERRANRSAHDKWNNKGSKGNGSWRFSDEID